MKIRLGTLSSVSQSDLREAFAKYDRGDRITGHISRVISDLGFVVPLQMGIEGIVHRRDLDWNEPGEEAIARYKVGIR